MINHLIYFFCLTNKTNGGVLTDWPYEIELESGEIIEGRTDGFGHTEKISSDEAKQAELRILEPDVTPINPYWDQ